MKNRTRLTIKIVLLCVLQAGMYTLRGQQPLSFKHLTVESGLSSNSTLSIAQDQSGYLWVGTMDGLNRYDGSQIRIYRSFLYGHWHGTQRKITCLLVDRKDRLWIGTNDGLFIYQQETESFLAFFTNKNEPNSLSHNSILALYLDRGGAVWIGTENGLHKAKRDRDSLAFVRIPLPAKNSAAAKKVYSVLETSQGELLAGTNEGLLRLSFGTGQLPVETAFVQSGMEVTSLVEDSQRQFWVGTRTSGLLKLDQHYQLLDSFDEKDIRNGLLSNVIRKLHLDAKGNLWIGTMKGLNILHLPSGKLASYEHKPEDNQTLNFNSIYDIFQDRQHNTWIATFFGGLNYAEAMENPFRIYQDGAGTKGVSSNIISTIIEDKSGQLWVGTEAEGVNVFDPVRKVFKAIRNDANHSDVLSSNLVKDMLMVDDKIWLGLHEGGVTVVDLNGRRIATFDAGVGPNAINSRHVNSLMLDHQGRIWIGHEAEGINIYDPRTRTMKDFHQVFPGKQLNSKAITALFKDTENNIWIGTWQGLSVLDKSGINLQVIAKSVDDDQQLSDYIYCIREDKDHHIWVAAHSGLYTYDKVQKKLRKFGLSSNRRNYVPVSIVADNNNNLWVGTKQGLKLIDAARKQVFTFNVEDGLPGNVFNSNSSFIDSRGQLFLGSHNGLIEFDPRDIAINKYAPSVEFTGLQVHGKVITAGDSTGVLPANISTMRKIQLRYDQNVIDIDYAVMNLIKPAKNRSAYLLEGYDRDWIYPENNRASFTNLPTGNYRLLVKAANNDGIWNETPAVLQIEVLPPPWKTWWAYTLYALTLGLLAFGIAYFFSSRTAMRRRLRYEHMMYVKQQELYQMKMDFFTHISHELRTPLTLIVGPLEVLAQMLTGNQQAQKMLHTIRHNAERLVKLTNDLLAFRKAEAGHTQLAPEKADIVAFAKTIFEKFEGEATRRSMHYHFESATPLLEVNFDKHHMEIVLTNLLSNAFKFTDDNGNIDFTIKEPHHGMLDILVRDNGIGIPSESQDKIFSGFYQAGSRKGKHAGSGIGLAFSRRLVELHRGSLSFRSGINEATGKMETCFTVSIPLENTDA